MSISELRPDPSTVPAPLTDYQRSMYAARAPQTVSCPFCHAWAGMSCISTVNGHTTWTHAKRKAAVAHLSDEEKIAAYAGLLAERKRTRDQWETAERARLADPAYVAQRDATRKWWNDQLDAIRDQAAAEESDFRSRCDDTPFRNFRTHADGCRCKHTGEVEYTPEFAAARRRREHKESLRGTLPVTDLAARRGGTR